MSKSTTDPMYEKTKIMNKEGCLWYRSGNIAPESVRKTICPKCQDCWVKNNSSEEKTTQEYTEKR